MSAVIDAMWQQVEPDVFITRAEWERGLEGWAIEPVEIGGELAFAVLTRGPELHFASFGRRAPISPRMIRERIAPLVAQYGYVRTRTPKDATRQRRFNEAFGFCVEGADEFFIHYRLDASAGRHQCRS